MWHSTKSILYIYVIVKITNCCDCNRREDSLKHTKSDDVPIDKLENDNTLAIPLKKAFTKANEELQINELNETRFKIVVAEFDESQENDDTLCPYLKNGIALNLDRMADVWQTVYYRTTEKLSCFKIYIRKTTDDERKYYAETYGDSNGTINWIDCLLEIRSSHKHYSIGRKHVLQGISMDKGVFQNIIILENKNTGNFSDATLSVESPDQWMVFNKMLMMRDCDNGDIIVFSRVPHQLRLEAILYSLKIFGDESRKGILACDEDGRISRSSKIVPKGIIRRYFRVQ